MFPIVAAVFAATLVHLLPLPSLPSLSLDATGVLDQEYLHDIPVLQALLREELVNVMMREKQNAMETLINTAPRIMLRTWDETLTKTKLKTDTESAHEYWAPPGRNQT